MAEHPPSETNPEQPESAPSPENDEQAENSAEKQTAHADPKLDDEAGQPSANGNGGQAGGDNPGSDAPAESSEKTKTEELAKKVAELEDRVLRLHAELENTRKRAQRELEESRQYAPVGLLREILPVVDNMELAMQAAEKTEDVASLKQGFRMVADQLQAALAQQGCQRIAALHLPFDPNLHEAVSRQPSEEHPEMTIVQELRPGYKLHERVIRPSQVIVSMGQPETESDKDEPAKE